MTLWERLRQLVDGTALPSVGHAYKVAERAHRGQVRDDGVTPYLVHVLDVALVLAEEVHRGEAALLQIALLHDTVEDTPVTGDMLRADFGPLVADGVLTLTKPWKAAQSRGEGGGKAAPEEEDRYYQAILDGHEFVRLVKCADRLANLREMRDLCQPERWERYVSETRERILPIADRTHPYLAETLRAELL